MKFKVGDRVKHLGTGGYYSFGPNGNSIEKGDTFIISAAQFDGSGNVYNVKGTHNENSAVWCNMEDNFELVSPKNWKEKMMS